MLVISGVYLCLLFGLAIAGDRGAIPRHWVRHPAVYTLSLGVFAGVWAIYGTVGMVAQSGYGYLAYYLGLSGAFLLAPVLLNPILRIIRTYQLTSLADLFAFRYRSQLAGTLVTLVSLASVLALLSLQINAVEVSAQLFSGSEQAGKVTAVAFCAVIAAFTIIFGAGRRQQENGGHQGLILAIAFDSALKLLALLSLGLVLYFGLFGGESGLDNWLDAHALEVSVMALRIDDGSWRAVMLMSFAGALVLPHMFHMIFSENPTPRALSQANWAVPLFLLLLAIPIPLILWAGIELDVRMPKDFYALGVAQALQSPTLTALVFISGLSAASGLMIVSTLAVAGMIVNHILLPLRTPREQHNIYGWLRGLKQIVIAAIILAALVFHELVGDQLELAVLGAVALSGALQLLPGALAVIYWPEGNRRGLVAGLIAGSVVWCISLAVPMSLGVNGIGLLDIESERNNWWAYTFASLALNLFVFAIVSVITRTDEDENQAAEACSLGALSRPNRQQLVASSGEDFVTQLTRPLGAEVAEREVQRAMRQLKLSPQEYRPFQLRRLRDQIEINLSGLLGPSVSQDLMKRYLGFKPLAQNHSGQDIHYVERALGVYENRLTGLAGELDNLRRHYRQTLQNLPIPACSVGDDREILMWNQAMEELTGINAEEVVGARLFTVPSPWHELLEDFVEAPDLHVHKHRLDLDGQPHWLNLHKSALAGPEHSESGNIILVEDQTETRRLEEELMHSERLASVGRLAAGVAHEVGNPVTGISSLAQNLRLETDEPEVLQTAEQILQQTRRISSILQSLMNFARSGNYAQATHYEPVVLRRCVEEAINLLSLASHDHQLQYRNACPQDLEVFGDEQRLVQIFINLLSNARDASSPGGEVLVSGKRIGSSAIIEVTDQGTGIPQGQLEHIFEPFYTTKGPNEGTGLGLSLVYSIVEEHYGHIQVQSPVNFERQRGTRVTLTLPARERDAETGSLSDPAPSKV